MELSRSSACAQAKPQLCPSQDYASAEVQHAYLAALLGPMRAKVDAALAIVPPNDQVGVAAPFCYQAFQCIYIYIWK